MHAISLVHLHDESQNISFITKEYYFIKQQHSKPHHIFHLQTGYMYITLHSHIVHRNKEQHSDRLDVANWRPIYQNMSIVQI